MTSQLKVRKIGNSLGLIVTKELSDPMHVKEGDALHAVVDANGGVRITLFDPHFDDALKAFERTRRRYRNALKELAK
jgi:putative addiction module antidote